MTRVQGLVAGFSGLIFGVTVWLIAVPPTHWEGFIIGVVGFALVTFGVILFTVVLEEEGRPHA